MPPVIYTADILNPFVLKQPQDRFRGLWSLALTLIQNKAQRLKGSGGIYAAHNLGQGSRKLT